MFDFFALECKRHQDLYQLLGTGGEFLWKGFIFGRIHFCLLLSLDWIAGIDDFPSIGLLVSWRSLVRSNVSS